ncbi:MAG: leucine-rich repeat domain-containing protein, partial [Clostridium sp.]|nr:leucine-rich repeat domain-containing protein [Clostridium sp.]
VISGEGNMEENVYRHFVDIDMFIKTVKSLLADAYTLDVEDVKHTIPAGVNENDLLDVDANIIYHTEDGTVLNLTDEVREAANPAMMLKYSPDALRFEGNVTSISDGAFVCCDDLTEITLPSTIRTIGKNAFSYCTNLTSITLNEGLESIGDCAFMYCRNLKNIDLPTTVKSIGSDAFFYIAEDSVINCPTVDVFNLIDYGMFAEGRNARLMINI